MGCRGKHRPVLGSSAGDSTAGAGGLGTAPGEAGGPEPLRGTKARSCPGERRAPFQHGQRSGDLLSLKGQPPQNSLGRENVSSVGTSASRAHPTGLCHTRTRYPGFRTLQRPNGPPLSVPVTTPSAHRVCSQEPVGRGHRASSSLRVREVHPLPTTHFRVGPRH